MTVSRRRAAHPGGDRATSTQTDNNAANLVLRDAPASGPWTATTKINFEGAAQYQQAGIIALRRRRRTSRQVRPHRPHDGGADEKFEFIHETRRRGATTTAADSTAEHRGGLPGRLLGAAALRRDERDRRVLDRRDRLDAGRACLRRCRRRAGSGCSPSATTATAAPPVAAFDSFRSPVRAAPGRPEPRRRVRRLDPRQDALERDRARHARVLHGVGEQPDHHDRARRHLHGRHQPAAEQLHPPVGRPRRRGLGDRDEDRLAGRRRLRPGRPDRLRGRRQLRQARPDRRRRPDADQPHRAAHGDRGHADRTGRRPADRGRHRHDLLPAPDQERDELHGRVLARRHDVDAGRHGDQPDGEPAVRRLRLRPAGRGPGRHRGRSTTSCSTAATRASRATASPAAATSSTTRALDKTKWNAHRARAGGPVRARGRLARDHDGQRRHLHRRRPGADEELHPAGRRTTPARTG